MYYKVEGNSNLVRDKETNAILNVNSIEYENYKKIKQNKKKEEDRISNLESDVNEIKDDLSTIKKLLLDIKNGT
jgi:seryl-tRNA synthetase